MYCNDDDNGDTLVGCIVSLANTKNQGGDAIGCLAALLPSIGCSDLPYYSPHTAVIFPDTLQFGEAQLLWCISNLVAPFGIVFLHVPPPDIYGCINLSLQLAIQSWPIIPPQQLYSLIHFIS